jgi:RNA polymerase sigma-70 factor (ECF subfamily)
MAKNNEALFTNLYATFYPMVLNVCKGFVRGDPDQAKDITQDVFINTWNSLDKFKGASSYKTWIYRITVNTCLKYIRDRKDQGNVSVEVAIQIPTRGTGDKHAASDDLYVAIGELGEVDRLIIMMVLDELEYEEIANVVGISESNLRVKIHRIKKQLKEILKKHGRA